MVKFVQTDGGRAAAGFKGKAGDCVVRAVAIASALPYKIVYKDIANLNKRSKTNSTASGRRTVREGTCIKNAGFKRYMRSLGFVWTPTMTIGSGCIVHLNERELPSGALVVAVSKHYAAFCDGVLYDTFDCSNEGRRCVYGYWSKSALKVRYQKSVSLPIVVPFSDLCDTCQFFDNKGGHPHCHLNLGTPKPNGYGYEKPQTCKDLKPL